MTKKIAVFDLDGTLLDAYEAVAKTFNYSLKKLGYSTVSYEVVKRSVGGGDVNLAGKFVKKDDITRLISLYRENHVEFLDGNVRLLDGCEELLTFLRKQNLKVGVATNRAKFSIDTLLSKLNIKQYFDIIFTADDVENPKPHPDMLIRIMNFFNIQSKDDIFYVGDMDIDYFAGKNAGIDTYIVATGSSLKKDLKKIEGIKLFDNLIDLKRYLEDKS
jgi:phosphoglycolate phosphatase